MSNLFLEIAFLCASTSSLVAGGSRQDESNSLAADDAAVCENQMCCMCNNPDSAITGVEYVAFWSCRGICSFCDKRVLDPRTYNEKRSVFSPGCGKVHQELEAARVSSGARTIKDRGDHIPKECSIAGTGGGMADHDEKFEPEQRFDNVPKRKGGTGDGHDHCAAVFNYKQDDINSLQRSLSSAQLEELLDSLPESTPPPDNDAPGASGHAASIGSNGQLDADLSASSSEGDANGGNGQLDADGSAGSSEGDASGGNGQLDASMSATHSDGISDGYASGGNDQFDSSVSATHFGDTSEGDASGENGQFDASMSATHFGDTSEGDASGGNGQFDAMPVDTRLGSSSRAGAVP